VEDFFGTPVADPYRWLEQLDSEQTRSWIEAQNELSFPFLESVPARAGIKQRLTDLWNFERFERRDVPFKANDRYFIRLNPGLLDQAIVYVTDSLDNELTVFLDPNSFSEDGTVALGNVGGNTIVPNPDGDLVAYAKADAGSDWNTWHFREFATGEDLPDVIQHSKFFPVAWAPDGSGVYYSRYPAREDGTGDGSKPMRLFFHTIGTQESADELVYDLTDEPRHRDLQPYPVAEISDDGRFLVITVIAGSFENQIHYLDLTDPGAGIKRLIGTWEALYGYIGNDGSTLFFTTTKGAPNSRVVAIDVANPDPSRWRELIPEAEEALQDVSYVGGHLVAEYLKDAKSLVRVFRTDGTFVRDVELPGIGTAYGFEGRGDDPETFFLFTSFTTPMELWAYDVAADEARLVRRPSVSIDPEEYVTEQVFYTSGDGTRIPMFLSHKKGIELDGTNPTLLYGYGGFNVSYTPRFSTSTVVWMEMGGVYALANIRGGGEYGEAWHLAGARLNKQNVFDDFIAAAEWLIDNHYTSTPKLAIEGGSNGGLLVGACVNQRPDLFGAAVAEVGVLDMIRYHTQSANARNWSTDYGLSENEDDFRAQIAYSPYHNTVEGACYPPTLITTADHDDRVAPWHSFKFAAALQRAQGCDNAILLRIETRAGHSTGKPTWMRIDEAADVWAFLAWALEM
jgi:prolyl oligopeptidase